MYTQIMNNSKTRGSLTSQGCLVHCLNTLAVKEIFLIFDGNFACSACVCWFWLHHCAPLTREWLHLLSTLPSGSRRQQYDAPLSLLSAGRTNSGFSSCLYASSQSFWWLFIGLAAVCPCFFIVYFKEMCLK